MEKEVKRRGEEICNAALVPITDSTDGVSQWGCHQGHHQAELLLCGLGQQ